MSCEASLLTFMGLITLRKVFPDLSELGNRTGMRKAFLLECSSSFECSFTFNIDVRYFTEV